MKLLIIGCGSIGKRHVKNACDLSETAVFDENNNLAKSIAKENNALAFNSLKTAFDWEPDGVIVATPNHTHVPIGIKVLEAGFDVLIEKPISNDLASANTLIEQAKKLKKKIFVVCNMRFHSGIKVLRKNLHKLGKPKFAIAHVGHYLPNMRPGADYRELYASNKSMGGGVVLDAIHEIDYLINFFGSVKSVKSTLGKLSDLEIDVEDYAEIILIHNNNVHSSLHMDYMRQFKRRGCEIVGDNGMLLWQSEGKSPEFCQVNFYSCNGSKVENLFDGIIDDPNEMYKELLINFCDAIKGRNHYLLNGSQALQQLKIVKNIKKTNNF